MTSERKLVLAGSPFSILHGEEKVNTTSMGKTNSFDLLESDLNLANPAIWGLFWR